MWMFPIVQDHYGDAYKVLGHLDQHIPIIPDGTHQAFFKYGLSPWDGHTTVLALVTYLAYFAGITYQQSFHLIDAIFGALYVFCWLKFVGWYFIRTSTRWFFGLAGVTAPFLLLFFGHIESYAPAFVCFLSLPVLILVYLRKREKKYLALMGILLVISIKVHAISLLYLPILGLLLIDQYASKKSSLRKLLTWRGASLGFLLPIFIAGAVLYFFVFGDHVDPRELSSTPNAFDRLFLPIFSPPPPLDRYNLLSWNHIFDYFSEMLLWSPVALFLILALILEKRKEIDWHPREILFTGLPLILFASLFFMINPLLSMQLDWDMMAIPAPLFLVFVAVVFQQVEHHEWISKLWPVGLALALLSLPCFILHTQKAALSQRYESLGIRMFRTYYEWSERVILDGLRMAESEEEYLTRLDQVITKLEPHALENIDFTFSRLYVEKGRYYLREKKDPATALQSLRYGLAYFPHEGRGLLYSLESYFLRKEFKEAFTISQHLMKLDYPSEKKAHAIAVHCALEAGLREEALRLSAEYIGQWNDNPTMKAVYDGLRDNSATMQELTDLFSKGE